MEKKLLETQFVLCIENGGCEDLEKRKFYQILPDEKAAQEGYLRIVDESQEDYLYPASYFISIKTAIFSANPLERTPPSRPIGAIHSVQRTQRAVYRFSHLKNQITANVFIR